MCTTCGCDSDQVHEHHEHDHHHHEHKVIDLKLDVLAKSNALAAQNRAWLKQRDVFMLNLMSSPGAGKTTLLEKTARELPLFVIEGDQATTLDRDRLRQAGAKCIQINTGTGCHLDPHMVLHGLEDLAVPERSCVVVENVGNLVCPALFDLGEAERVVLLSTPEGDDKPLKYPHMFQAATLVLVNKIDLLEHVPFDLDRCKRALSEVCPRARVETISAHRGTGLDRWYAWLRERGA